MLLLNKGMLNESTLSSSAFFQYFYILLIFFFISCSSNLNNSKIADSFYNKTIAGKLQAKDSFSRRHFPLGFKEFAKDNNLDNLENGFDSLQLRIWYSLGKFPNIKILIIKVNSIGKVSVSSLLISRISRSNKLQLSLVGSKSFSNTPKEEEKLLELIKLTRINEYPFDFIYNVSPETADGSHYFLEIADKFRYKHYAYRNLEDKLKHYEHIKLLNNLFKYLEDEFDLYDLKKL